MIAKEWSGRQSPSMNSAGWPPSGIMLHARKSVSDHTGEESDAAIS